MDNNNLYDIAVIGGGLAGLCLSIQAADLGYKVVLFEREQYPFHKVCGEYISMESFDFLQRLGVPLKEWQLPVIKDLSTSDVKGNSYSFKLPLGGFGVSRFKLDDFLYHLAMQKGVAVYTETKVTDAVLRNDIFELETTAGTFTARLAAGAFGKRSNLDVKWARNFTNKKQGGLNNFIGVKYHVKYNHSNTTIALHNFHNGYCGFSKIEDDVSCLCYLTTADNLAKSGNSISRMEQKILGANPILQKIFSEAEFLYDKPLTISQVSFAPKTQVQNNVLLTGDSAGLITPLCGNGMSIAMHASKLAMHCMHKFLEKKIDRASMENDYSRIWKENFASRLWVGRRVQQLFGGNLSTSMFLKTMNAVPFVANLVIRSTHGEAF